MKLSISEVVSMGLQHVVAAVAGIATPGTMIAEVCQLSSSDTIILIRTSSIPSAIATLTQLFPILGKVGSWLPAIMGTGFAYVPVLMAIGADFRIVTIFDSQLAGSILVIIVGLFVKEIRILFPPLVTGTVILNIGLSLSPVAIKYMAGGASSADFGSAQNWLIALLTFATVFHSNYFAEGFLKLSAILSGMVIGYLISLALGMAGFKPAQNARTVQIITPFHSGSDFQLVPIFTLVVMPIVDAAQAIGQFTAAMAGAIDRDATSGELPGEIMGSGLTNFISSLSGSIPVATFGQDVGLVTVTKMINKYALVSASVILLIAGFVPKVTALLITIPYAIIGSIAILVFAFISMTGTRMVASQGMIPRNTGVVRTALAFGTDVTLSTGSLVGFPTWTTAIFGNPEVILATLVAVPLSVILEPKEHVALEQRLFFLI